MIIVFIVIYKEYVGYKPIYIFHPTFMFPTLRC